MEVAIYGEPGAYVGLSGIDVPFFTMQAGNELTYANVSIFYDLLHISRQNQHSKIHFIKILQAFLHYFNFRRFFVPFVDVRT